MCWSTAPTIFLVSWYTFSAFQCLLIWLRLSAIRLCSLTHKVCMDASAICSLTLKSPASKHPPNNWHRLRGGLNGDCTCGRRYLGRVILMVPLFAEDQKARQMERQVWYKHPTWKKLLTMTGTGHTTVLPICLSDGLEKKVNSAYKRYVAHQPGV